MSSFWNRSFYHLLRMAVDICLHQASELGYAVVDMHNIVAGLNLLKLFERQGQLSAARTVAF